MASEPIHIPVDQNLDYQMVAHIVEGLKKEQKTVMPFNARLKMHTELRMLTFWRLVTILKIVKFKLKNISYRAIISECMASFLYVFIVCGAAAGAGIGASVSSVLLTTSLASGLSMAVLTHCFIHISGKNCEGKKSWKVF